MLKLVLVAFDRPDLDEPLYIVRLGGQCLCRSTQPMRAAARALLKLGYPPGRHLSFRHEGARHAVGKPRSIHDLVENPDA